MSIDSKSRLYVLVRDAQSGYLRSCWSAGPDTLYCGMCLQGLIEPQRGAACPVCDCKVERVLEIADGGTPRPLATLRARGTAAARASRGVLLPFKASGRERVRK